MIIHHMQRVEVQLYMGSDNLLTVPLFIRRGGVWWSNMQSCLTTRSCFSCPIMFGYDTMKASHGGNNELSDSTTHKRGCHGIVLLSVMTGWHSWTSSQLLQLLLLYHHLPQNCQLQSIIYRTRLPTEDIVSGLEKQTVACVPILNCQSPPPRIEITSYFNNGVKLMKEKKETNASRSLFLHLWSCLFNHV